MFKSIDVPTFFAQFGIRGVHAFPAEFIDFQTLDDLVAPTARTSHRVRIDYACGYAVAAVRRDPILTSPRVPSAQSRT